MPRINPSRITPPSLPHIIERPRLTDRLKQNEDKRIILILGQAAQGKSTLATSFVRSSHLPTAWINIVSEDENPANLFKVTAHGLNHVLEKKDLEFLQDYPALQLGPRNEEQLYRDWVRTLFGQVDQPIRIAFDGLDRLDDEAPSFHLLRLMLDEAPDKTKFMFLSRKDPPLSFQDWKIKQQAFVFYNRDLAFTYKETKSFLRRHCGLNCSREQVSRIWKATEGWTGGLILLSQVLDSTNGTAAELTIFDGLPDRFQAEVYFYFAKEIFSGLSEQDAWFLMHSSVFEEVDPVFLDELLDMKGSENILQELLKRNLFVHAVHGSTSGWIYRYHLLFRDFLQRMWKRRVGLQQRKDFLNRIGIACSQRKDLESAADFFLQAEEFVQSASILKDLGGELIQAGRDKDLAWMLLRFPEEILQANPWLLLYRVCCRRYTHAKENVADLRKSKTMFRQANDIPGRLLTLGYLLEAVMLLGWDIIPIHSLLADGEKLLSNLGPSLYPREQALLWLQMGFCYALRGEQIMYGFRASQNAFFLARQIKDRRLQIHALINSMIPMTYVGEFTKADEIRCRVEGLLQQSDYP
ncbi:MAG: hypothetical protein K9K79_01680 [Desulfohalobiaceae bacterium]|nr:hypothetical protein [Desulfohalobiaceae bacterium]